MSVTPRDDAEAFLEAFSELVGGGFHRRAVYGVGDVFSSSPFGALVVQFLHDSEGKFSAFIRCMGYAEHADAHFIEACIAEGNGAVVVEEELVDRFALLETSDSAVLPEDRSHVGDGAEQSFMAAAERSVAEFERASRISQNLSISRQRSMSTSTRLMVTTP